MNTPVASFHFLVLSVLSIRHLTNPQTELMSISRTTTSHQLKFDCGKKNGLLILFIWGIISTQILGLGVTDKNKPVNFFCQNPQKPEVIAIVGAGLSGMLLSLKLAEKGCNVILLEARDHVGGRIYTDQQSGADLGAQWFVSKVVLTL